jgi:hypothetical protein
MKMAGEKKYGWITGTGAAGMLGWLALSLVPGLGIARIIRMLAAVPQGVAALRTATNLLPPRESQNCPRNPAPASPDVQKGRVPFKEQS